MKYSRTLRMLGIVIVMSLLLAVVPALPALATNDIALSVSSAKVGDTVTITGTNFTPSTESSEKWVRVIFSSNSAIAGNYIDNHVITYENVANAQVGEVNMADEGNFSVSFTIPSSLTDGTTLGTVTSGTYYIYITLLGQTLIKSVSQFTIAAGEITISPTLGPVDTAVRIAGTGFVPSTAITMNYDNVAVTIGDGDTVTNTSGNFDSYLYVPESVAGSHTITIIVSGSDVSKTFTVQPDILISPQSGEAGTTVSMSCAGFSRRAQPTIYFNTYPVETLTGVIADTKGSFSTSFIVPEGLTAGDQHARCFLYPTCRKAPVQPS